MSRRTGSGHTGWCTADHRCNLAEHRSDDIVIRLSGAGRAVLTRVRDANGRDHAEIRLRVPLPTQKAHARTRLVSLLVHLHTLVGPARRPHRRTA